MKLKKIIKYLIISIFVLLIGKIVFQRMFDHRPFIFEKYKSSKQFAAAAKLKFPVGSDVTQAMSIFRKSGAKCYELKCYEQYEGCVTLAYCDYLADFFSFNSLDGYEVKMYVDKDHKLIELMAWKVPTPLFGT